MVFEMVDDLYEDKKQRPRHPFFKKRKGEKWVSILGGSDLKKNRFCMD